MQTSFIGLLTLYLAVDVKYSFGNSRRNRVWWISVFIAIHSFLCGIYYIEKYKDDYDNIQYEIVHRCNAGGNLLNGIVCILILLTFKFTSVKKKIYPPGLVKWFAVFLIIGTGTAYITVNDVIISVPLWFADI